MAQVTTVAAEPSAPAPLDLAVTAPRKGAILVVEDRDDVRGGIVQLLALYGYTVTGVGTAERALAYLEHAASHLALILLDLRLPGVSGTELRARQLADPQLAIVPTVVVTACEPDPQSRAELQPAAWLEKPFRGDQLLALVEKYVIPN
ncbi:MAG TPA: response regulator [Vicinamibacterales bacterium]|nr:response regulator [Vicinamibacterales bacterium]